MCHVLTKEKDELTLEMMLLRDFATLFKIWLFWRVPHLEVKCSVRLVQYQLKHFCYHEKAVEEWVGSLGKAWSYLAWQSAHAQTGLRLLMVTKPIDRPECASKLLTKALKRNHFSMQSWSIYPGLGCLVSLTPETSFSTSDLHDQSCNLTTFDTHYSGYCMLE